MTERKKPAKGDLILVQTMHGYRKLHGGSNEESRFDFLRIDGVSRQDGSVKYVRDLRSKGEPPGRRNLYPSDIPRVMGGWVLTRAEADVDALAESWRTLDWDTRYEMMFSFEKMLAYAKRFAYGSPAAAVAVPAPQ